jgi:16S rRNA (uracil1498-N3)-methyltransferase
MVRIFIDGPLQSGASLALPDAQARHVSQVLRMAPGDEIVLFNGRGGEFSGTIAAITQRAVQVEVGAYRARDAEPPLDTTLVQAIARAERMDYTIQKAVELGVRRIAPVVSERSVVRMDEDRAANRVKRWQAIAVSAAEQSGRTRVPPVEPIVPLERWLEATKQEPCRIWFEPGAEATIGDLPETPGAYFLVVGPEGGFAERERALFRARGLTAVSLGPRVLRAETVALVALTLLQARFGDLN